MVLEEATASYDSNASADSSNAPDGADFSTDYRFNYVYDPNGYANVMPLVGQFMGYTAENRRKFNDAMLARISHVAKRRLTDVEVSALTRNQYNTTAIMSWGTGLGIGMGVARAYQLSADVTFPGINMTERFGTSYDKWFMLRGRLAKVTWHTLRYSAYIQLGLFVGRWASASFAALWTMNSFTSNPDLKVLRDVLRKPIPETQERVRAQVEAQAQAMQNGGAQQGENTQDYSPQGNLGNDPDHSVDTGILSDAQRMQREREAEAVSRREAQRQPQYPYRAPQQQRQTQQPTSSFDEDSPTGGTGLLDFDGPPQASSGGSAWDRVRQQSASGGQNKASSSRSFPSVQQQNAPAARYGRPTRQSPEDSFSFSNTDEERQLAKAEAQRAFDERLERERRGEDSNPREKTW